MASYDLLNTGSGRSVVIALDHGLTLGSVEGFQNPPETLQSVLDGNPDGVLVGPHFARRYSEQLEGAKTILTSDVVTFSTNPGAEDGMDVWTPAFSTDLLTELDPAGVKTVLVFGREDRDMFANNIKAIAERAEQLRGTGIPLIVEPVMWGSRIPPEEKTAAHHIAHGCRMAWEYGADILKVPYTGDVESFRKIIEDSPVPVMMLGGAATGTTEELLEDVEDAMDAGADGLIVGRKAWKSDDPSATIQAMGEIVRDGKAAKDIWG